MGANLKGLANTLKNKIYQAKKKGVDTSFIPRGYSKLADSQLLNLINRLGQQTNGKNYSYHGINNTIDPKIPKVKSISPRSNLGKYMKKTGKIKLVDKYICDHQGYGKDNPKPGSHLVIPSDKEVCTTMTTFVGLNKCVVEVYEEDNTENSDSE